MWVVTEMLSREIKIKKAIINVQSMDNAYFAWLMIATLYLARNHTNRESSYQHYNTKSPRHSISDDTEIIKFEN